MCHFDHQRCFFTLSSLLAFFVFPASTEEYSNLRRVVRHDVKQDPTLAISQATGACIKDTSRPCRPWHKSTVVDHATQCLGGQGAPFVEVNPSVANASAHQAYCSADQTGAQSGTCLCGPGYCADTDMLCHRSGYQIVNEVFTITTKAYPNEKLYMTPDGKVMSGVPPDPRAAQWRISVTGKGVKILWTELYTTTVMQEYESCQELTDQFGLTFTKCVRIVGHVPNPRAPEMGWYLELHDGDHHLGLHPREYVQLRSASTWDLFYISPLTREGKACESRGHNCPGDSGAFSFDPPILERMDIVLDSAPGALPPGLAAYRTTVFLAAALICCLGCVFNADSQSLSTCTTILMIPFSQIAHQIGLGKGAAI